MVGSSRMSNCMHLRSGTGCRDRAQLNYRIGVGNSSLSRGGLMLMLMLMLLLLFVVYLHDVFSEAFLNRPERLLRVEDGHFDVLWPVNGEIQLTPFYENVVSKRSHYTLWDDVLCIKLEIPIHRE